MAFPTIPTVAAGRVLFANQADTTATRTFPAFSGLTYANGDLLLAIVTTYQSTTNPQFSSWSNGFTELSAGGDQGSSTTMGIGIAYKIANGTESGSLTVTQAATITGHASMCLMAIPGAHLVTPPEAGTIVNGTAAAANPASFNPAGWDAEDTLWISVVTSGMTSGTGTWTATGTTAPTNFTDRADSNTTDSSTVGQTEIAVSFRQQNAASQDIATGGVDTSNARNSALALAVRPVASGEGSLAGVGGLVLAAALTLGGSAALSGAGGLTVNATVESPVTYELRDPGFNQSFRRVPPQQPWMPGRISFTPSTAQEGSGTLNGVGGLTATANLTLPGVATLSGVGGLITKGDLFLPSAGTLNGVGGLGAQGDLRLLGSASLAGVGGLAAQGDLRLSGSATLAGVGGLTVNANQGIPGSATLNGVGGLTASALQLESGGAALSGVGGLGAQGDLTLLGSATLAGIGGMSASADSALPGSASLAGVGGMSASAVAALTGSASLAGVGGLGATAEQIHRPVITLSGTGGLSADGTIPGGPDYELRTPGFNAQYRRAAPQQPWLPARLALGVEPTVWQGSAALNGVGGLTATGDVSNGLTGSATLSGVGGLSVTAQLHAAGRSTLPGVGGLTATGTSGYFYVAQDNLWPNPPHFSKRYPQYGTINQRISFEPGAGPQTYQGSATLNGVGGLSASVFGSVWQGTATLNGVGGLTADGEVKVLYFPQDNLWPNPLPKRKPRQDWVFSSPVALYTLGATHQGSAALNGVGGLSASAVLRAAGSATLNGVGGLAGTASQIQTWQGSAALSGVGGLGVSANQIHQVGAALAGVGGLGASAGQIQTWQGSATLAGVGGLTASLGAQEYQASAALAGVGGLTASGLVEKPGSAVLAGVGGMEVDSTLLRNDAAVFVGTGGLSATALQRHAGTGVLSGVGGLQTYGQLTALETAALAGVGGLSAGSFIGGIVPEGEMIYVRELDTDLVVLMPAAPDIIAPYDPGEIVITMKVGL